MIVLDTNVASELMRAAPLARVREWLDRRPSSSQFLTVVSEAELRYGVALLPAGRRRRALTSEVETLLSREFAGRVLPYDSAAAGAYADIASSRRAAGRPISYPDAQIAAIARSRGAAVATRNVRDFEGCGIEVLDPWAGEG